MEISMAIVTYNNMATIKKCIESIYNYSMKPEMKFYIIDNGSTDGTKEWIKENYPDIRLIQNIRNIGFGRAHNQILPYMTKGYHFIINPDIEIKEDVVSSLIDYMEKNTEVHIVTPEIRNPNGSIQYLPKNDPSIRYLIISKIPGFHYLRKQYTRQEEDMTVPTDIEFCTGCFFCIRSQTYKAVGGFDNRYFMYFEDADLSRTIRKRGNRVVYYPLVDVYHTWKRENVKKVRGIKREVKSMILYFNKWGWRI